MLFTDFVDRFRLALAKVDAVPQLALMGVLTGLLTGLVIIAFRLLIEGTQAWMLPGADVENYEGLHWLWRFVLPLLGALLIAMIWALVQQEHRGVGVVHVLERLAYNQAYLPLKNMLLQFVGAALSIISGHSVGREGPGVHLGAASGSLLGQLLQLPNNTLRSLVACGVAASIGASFNTPIAGVIFAMEVIVLEYSIAGFTPVILAAVSATVLTRSVFGSSPAFSLPELSQATLWELPWLVLMGLFIGALAALFNRLLITVTSTSAQWPMIGRMSLAGVLTGMMAVAVPAVMGIGYDSVELCLSGELGLLTLLVLLLAKLSITAVGIGLGLPGGLIGPTLVMGASAGAFCGALVYMFAPMTVASPGFYAMLGMGAMMAAVLQAPLAALMALLELMLSTHVILPGMLTVVVASMTSRHLFTSDSVFRLLLKARGLDYANHPVAQSLRRAGAISAMERAYVELAPSLSREAVDTALQHQPQWIVVWDQDNEHFIALPAVGLVRGIKTLDQGELNLLKIPAERRDCAVIGHKATLQEALDQMLASSRDVVCVVRDIYHKRGERGKVLGVLTREMIDRFYRYP